MQDRFAPDLLNSTSPPELLTEADAASQPFVGQWNRLVSTTNWEKGRIIGAWRQSLIDQGAEVAQYSDESWAALVGGVTGQHVGRLRRVAQRFGAAASSYGGLFWSHFQAALDWDDAEMWLEGAVQNGWSVAAMRNRRWETLGEVESQRPNPADVVVSETDEDFEPARTSSPTEFNPEAGAGPREEGPDFGDEPSRITAADAFDVGAPANPAGEPVALVQPFADLPQLPDDLQDAVEGLKLAILHHKASGWSAVSLATTLQVLEGLKALASAPATDEAPF